MLSHPGHNFLLSTLAYSKASFVNIVTVSGMDMECLPYVLELLEPDFQNAGLECLMATDMLEILDLDKVGRMAFKNMFCLFFSNLFRKSFGILIVLSQNPICRGFQHLGQ
jgi:hypothetical protein